MTPTVERDTPRPRRSMLYMPASNPRALDKAKALPADGLIFDLEDAVEPDAKPAARIAAVAAANSKGYGRREILIRANGLDTDWFKDDIAAIARSAADGMVLPKVNDPRDVRRVDDLLRKGGAPETLALWAMMETPRGIVAAAAIAASTPRLAGFMIGTADLAKDLHCAHPADRAPMLYALQHCVLAARAHGIFVLDGIHIDLEDEAGFAAACRQARALGFDGKTLIHPKQIATANLAFAPSVDELTHARRIVAAHAEAAKQGRGVTLLGGRLVENLHVREAERLMAQAAAISELN
ncbi:MAG: CoA ester lyase [Rhodospirillaceae bacterium]|nr:CoA ester lyase [Rhodospirillaceae bacterium]